AALELNQADTAERLFQAAPRLLSEILAFTHAELFVPDGKEMLLTNAWRWQAEDGFRIPMHTVIGRAFRTGEPQYVSDTRLDDEYMVAPGAVPTRSELALPVKVGSTVRAVLNLEHTSPDAFGREDHDTLRAFARIMEEVLARLDTAAELEHERTEQQFLADLNQHLLMAEDARQAAQSALVDVVAHLGLDAGAVLELKQARLRPVAQTGSLPPELASRTEAGLEFGGLLQRAWVTKRPVHVDDLSAPVHDPQAAVSTAHSLASKEPQEPTGVRTLEIVPIVNAHDEVRAVLALVSLYAPRPLTQRQQHLLPKVARSLGSALDRTTLNRQLLATLDVIQRLARSDATEDLYQRAVEAAVELVPGAEAASVLVRDGDSFRYEAAVGFDLDALRVGVNPLSPAEELHWYGGSEADYLRGRGRVLRGAEVLRQSIASGTDRSPAYIESAHVSDIRANILIPIVDAGQVVALLNIDNMSDEDAFGSNALKIAEAYAQHIAVIVRQAEQVSNLEASLVTDSLTRLGNREGFQRRLSTELARALRYDHPLNIVMLDLNNFKQVNDRFGHTVGDSALVAVADVLRTNQRVSDSAFRWGGDEFVLLLPDVHPSEAQNAAERYAALVSRVEVNGLRLSVSVGVASYPEDGADPQTLLRRADDLMYYRKLGNVRPPAS
ncbi:MAG TPA: diguanylate cyclase, partial [Trueperaceae bacterium]|nr:diguanylate cyclase [Trueperaceae bacterium]